MRHIKYIIPIKDMKINSANQTQSPIKNYFWQCWTKFLKKQMRPN